MCSAASASLAHDIEINHFNYLNLNKIVGEAQAIGRLFMFYNGSRHVEEADKEGRP